MTKVMRLKINQTPNNKAYRLPLDLLLELSADASPLTEASESETESHSELHLGRKSWTSSVIAGTSPPPVC